MPIPSTIVKDGIIESTHDTWTTVNIMKTLHGKNFIEMHHTIAIMVKYCKNNIGRDNWIAIGVFIWKFKNPEDATLFKLQFTIK